MNPTFADALAQLPHGPEFRFVDRLTNLVPGKSGRGKYLLRGDEAFLKGHFPARPMVPGVILIEAVAQLAGTVAQTDPANEPLADLRLTAVRNAKILGSASPGQTLELSAEISGRFDRLVQARGEVAVAGQTILRCDIVLSGGSPEQTELSRSNDE